MSGSIVINFGERSVLEGALEQIDGRWVCGWVRQPIGAKAVEIDVKVDGRTVFSGPPQRRNATPEGDSGRRYFEVELSQPLLDGKVHRISAYFRGTRNELAHSPIEALLSALISSEWCVERSQLVGSLTASADGKLQIDVIADQAQLAAIEVLGKKNEAVPFTWWLPWRLIDGRPHEIALRLHSEAGVQLPHASRTAPIQFNQAIRSVIDSFQAGVLSGWAIDVKAPHAPLDIDVYDGETLISRTSTSELRPDVNQQFGITGTHGFIVPIPPKLFDGGEHRIRLMVGDLELRSGFDTEIPFTLSASLISGARAGMHPVDRFVGKVEQLDCKRVTGWAADREPPYRPVTVAVVVDGVAEVIVEANQFQKRFEQVTPSGHHGFLVELPTRLMNGTVRTVEVRIAEADIPLSRDPERRTAFPVYFPLIDYFAHAAPDPVQREFDALMRLPVTGAPALRVMTLAELPKVSAIILNWNGAHLLGPLLASIESNLSAVPLEIILIDHGSTDGSVALAEKFKRSLDLTIIERGENFSFSNSNNLGAKRATGEYLFFLNNDIVLTHDCVSPLASALAADTSIGMIGMRLVEPVLHKVGSGFSTHHCGIRFEQRSLSDREQISVYSPVEVGSSAGDLALALPMPAVTAAACMCRKEDFLAVGGFDEAYFYGLEDVDLCLRMRRVLGKSIVCDTSVTAIHSRSATRGSRGGMKSNPVAADPASQTNNRMLYARRFSLDVKRSVLGDLLGGAGMWRTKPLRVAFAVTHASDETKAGDFFTALELGDALRESFGWEVVFVRHTVTQLTDVDVVIAMRHDFDLTKVEATSPGLIAVAWVRNRVEQWLAAPSLPGYHIVLCASRAGCKTIAAATGRDCVLMPIATNERRFQPSTVGEAGAVDVVFTGNFWGVERDAINALDLDDTGGSFAIFGAGWDEHPQWSQYWRGALPYEELPAIYASAKIVIDDSHPVTRDWAMLNSRVFDALAAGTLVVTNCRRGSVELFDGLLPSFAKPEELKSLLKFYLTRENDRQLVVRKLRQQVLDRHTYSLRAQTLKTQLQNVAASIRIAIKVGIPNQEVRERWGDWHFARGLQRALQARGARVRIDLLPDWNGGLTVGDDVVIVLRGLSRYRPQPGALNLIWLISHPQAVDEHELTEYDRVFVASRSYAQRLAHSLGNKVCELLQCTDPGVFHPADEAVADLPTALFVGNSRKVRRKIVDDAIAAGIDFAVCGGDWNKLIDPVRVLCEFIPNEDLHRYYSSAKIVLNDHWPDMRQQGFISNRLFDAGACAATIISDEVSGLSSVFGDAVRTYRSPADLRRQVEELAAQPSLRRTLGEKLRQTILTGHTFDHRAEIIWTCITQELGQAAAKPAARAGIRTDAPLPRGNAHSQRG